MKGSRLTKSVTNDSVVDAVRCPPSRRWRTHGGPVLKITKKTFSSVPLFQGCQTLTHMQDARFERRTNLMAALWIFVYLRTLHQLHWFYSVEQKIG
jgi:hypothetical protein